MGEAGGSCEFAFFFQRQDHVRCLDRLRGRAVTPDVACTPGSGVGPGSAQRRKDFSHNEVRQLAAANEEIQVKGRTEHGVPVCSSLRIEQMAEQNVSEHQVQKPYNNFCVRDEKYLHEIRTRAELSERLTTRGAAVEKVRPRIQH